MYNELLDGEQFHNDDLTVLGSALEAVNFITIDHEKAANRNLDYIRENIARENAYQETHAENS